MSSQSELWNLVRSIPPGRVCGYGALGAALPNRVSGIVVGRWMAQCPEDVPWWRVVAKNGSLPIEKRSPYLGMDQEQLLRSEGVSFLEGRVNMSQHSWEP
ncbi:MAG TPA: MGMT family protein [Fimbriimonadaceae bacterium]|nr:MGMT family protein [Fimbriimonadaceae bacterium]